MISIWNEASSEENPENIIIITFLIITSKQFKNLTNCAAFGARFGEIAIDYLMCFVKKFSTFDLYDSDAHAVQTVKKWLAKQLSTPCGKCLHLSWYLVFSFACTPKATRHENCWREQDRGATVKWQTFKLASAHNGRIEWHFAQLLKYYPSFDFVITARDKVG